MQGAKKIFFVNHVFDSPGVFCLATGYGLDESWLPVQTGTGARSDGRRGCGVPLISAVCPKTYMHEFARVVLSLELSTYFWAKQ
jgi:hypothetical protein